MANATPQMPVDFPAWYATVSIGQSGAASTRWLGVATIVARAKREDIEALIRIAFKSKQLPAADGLDRFITVIREGDETFDTGSAERETQVLAAAALVSLMSSSPRAATAVTTAALAGARKPSLPMDIIGTAQNAIRTLAETTRARRAPPESAVPDVKWSLTAEEAGSKQPKDLVEGLQAAVKLALTSATERENALVQQLYTQQRLANEELQMLWWLIGEQATDGTPFDKLDTKSKIFMLAGELADRTDTLPGPNSVRALLSRAGIKSGSKITVPQAVNAMPEAWLQAVIKGRDISPVTHPIHSALQRRNETGETEAWVKNWAAVTEVDEAFPTTPLTLGELFYRERLLLRA